MKIFGTFTKSKGIAISLALIVLGLALFPTLLNLEEPTVQAETIELPEPVSAENRHVWSAATTVKVVNKYHYRNRPLDNEFSEIILNKYLELLDPQKFYFLLSDVKSYESYRFYIDDFLRNGNLDAPYAIFQDFQERVRDRMQYAKSMLEFPYDFQLKEDFLLDRATANWAVNKLASDDLWKKIVKHDMLNLKLEDTDSDSTVETLRNRYDRIYQSVSRTSSDDVFETFLNAYLRTIEPHSEYFSPHNSENLKINIMQQIEGIGAMLRSENEHTVIVSVVPGGPAARSEKIHEGDKIVGVGNNDQGEIVDVVGWRVSDVVDRIRGPKGTKVYLKILRKDALPGEIPFVLELVRDNVKLEDQIAKKSTVEIPTDDQILRLGVVSLPNFYSNLGLDGRKSNAEERSASSDVKRILTDLNQQRVDGIVIDLRGNGGGALSEAVKLTGMFIKSGPVVQIQKSDQNKEVAYDTDTEVVYSGPLVVLIDRNSASASEIFAGAIKDYQRGILIGETTYGKGVIQTLWPLDRWINFKNTGNLKITTAQYYRINGASTQHVGVIPHIVYPTNKFLGDFGERSFDNSLPADYIDSTEFTPWNRANYVTSNLDSIQEMSKTRTKFNPVFNYLVEAEEFRRSLDEKDTVSLNENTRRDELNKTNKIRLSKINELRNELGLFPVDELNVDAFPEELAGDAYLNEALYVLADLVSLSSGIVYQGAKFNLRSRSFHAN